MRGSAVVAALLVVAIGSAEARVKAGPGVNPGWHKLGAAAGSALDLFTTPTGAYSFRKLKSTYAGAAVRLRRASDSTEQDIGFLGFVPGLGSPFDAAAANAFCAATSCFVRTWYDQSGNGRDMTQSSLALQPELFATCLGSGKPCWRATGSAVGLAGGNVTPLTGKLTLSVVLNRRAGTGFCHGVQYNGVNYFSTSNVATTWRLQGGAGFIQQAVSDAVWHAGIGVIDGASSVVRIDSVEGTGTVTGSVATGAMQVANVVAGTSCDGVEAVAWDNYALTAAERAVLTNNQLTYWGF